MVLAVMGPPTHTDAHTFLHTFSVHEAILVYLHTRRWKREQESIKLFDRAHDLYYRALLAGVKHEQAEALTRDMRMEADKLSRPEHEFEVELTPAQQLFMEAGEHEWE